jgi:hypothetical protein
MAIGAQRCTHRFAYHPVVFNEKYAHPVTLR